MDNSSIHPTNFVPDFIRKAKLEEKEEKRGDALTERDKAFALLAESDYWVELKAYLESRIDSIRNLMDYNPEKADYQEIGQRFVVADMVATELRNIIFKVENAKTILDEQGKPKK